MTEPGDATKDQQGKPEPPVLPDVTRDEQDADWGERDDEQDRDEWYRRERPPHHE